MMLDVSQTAALNRKLTIKLTQRDSKTAVSTLPTMSLQFFQL